MPDPKSTFVTIFPAYAKGQAASMLSERHMVEHGCTLDLESGWGVSVVPNEGAVRVVLHHDHSSALKKIRELEKEVAALKRTAGHTIDTSLSDLFPTMMDQLKEGQTLYLRYGITMQRVGGVIKLGAHRTNEEELTTIEKLRASNDELRAERDRLRSLMRPVSEVILGMGSSIVQEMSDADFRERLMAAVEARDGANELLETVAVALGCAREDVVDAARAVAANSKTNGQRVANLELMLAGAQDDRDDLKREVSRLRRAVLNLTEAMGTVIVDGKL